MENEQMEPNVNNVPQESNQNQNVPPTPNKEGGAGPVIGIIIIIILLGLGGVYYFTTGVDQIQSEDAMMEESMSADEAAAKVREQGSSTDLADIEADLQATDFSGLDDASAEFESELQSQ